MSDTSNSISRDKETVPMEGSSLEQQHRSDSDQTNEGRKMSSSLLSPPPSSSTRSSLYPGRQQHQQRQQQQQPSHSNEKRARTAALSRQGGATPPSQVTFEGDTASAETLSTTASSSSIMAPMHHRCLPSPAPSQASSEEESVAEMGYMSEGSNLSVKDCPPSAGNHGLLDAHHSDDNTDNTCSNGNNCSNNTAADTTFMPAPRRLPHFFPKRQSAMLHHNNMINKGSSSNQHSNSSPGGGSTLMANHTTAASLESPATAAPATEEHRPFFLPKFREPQSNMWTASHAANLPTEDRSSSLVNLLLQPLPPNFDSETQLLPLEPDYKTLIRLNLWCVIDGHGGGAVATYASEVLLPHIAASVSRALGCAIVDRGVCTVNGQLRDANAMDLDGLIKTSDRAMGNPNSIHYRSPYEGTDSEGEEGAEAAPTVVERKQIASLRNAKANFDAATVVGSGSEATVDGRFDSGATVVGSSSSTVDGRRPHTPTASDGRSDRPRTPNPSVSGSAVDASVSSVKTSVKTAASPAIREALPGTHAPQEVAAISRAITESFLAVDEGWINSIDKVATAQTSCQSNGRWNSGACALVVFTVQRLDWTSVSEPDKEKEFLGPGHSRRNTSQNRDAARRRMLDYAARTKSASSMSTASSTSSLTTEEAVNASGLESEITETEGEEDDRSLDAERSKRLPTRASKSDRRLKEESLISPPGCCSCHCYRAHDAMLYTAHVGDCRAVLLGSAPPRTIKVRDPNHPDTTDDESSHHSSDETECLSSSDHDADSSEDEDVEVSTTDNNGNNGNGTSSPTSTPATAAYMNFPRRVVRQKSSRRRALDHFQGPYNPLPPLVLKEESEHQQQNTTPFDVETDIAARRASMGKEPSDSSTSSQDSDDPPPLIHLPPFTRPIDLTTDHSAYNPAEVTAVLRRCNNAPRAISAGVGGGIKRVAGSLAVTRALGDAYLKTPELSFLPYKRHAPYITARPEVNCRPLVKDVDKVLILATDGVWERASGEDVLRWVRNFYEERIAEAERRNNRRNQVVETSKVAAVAVPQSKEELETAAKNSQDGAERDLFEQRISEPESSRKRDMAGSPCPPAKRRKRSRHNRVTYNVADVIVRRVLNKVRRARNISSLQALMSLPQGRARRSKHDDITSSVVDLSAFVA